MRVVFLQIKISVATNNGCTFFLTKSGNQHDIAIEIRLRSELCHEHLEEKIKYMSIFGL
jgi:hypothetical protein